MTDTQKQIH